MDICERQRDNPSGTVGEAGLTITYHVLYHVTSIKAFFGVHYTLTSPFYFFQNQMVQNYVLNLAVLIVGCEPLRLIGRIGPKIRKKGDKFLALKSIKKNYIDLMIFGPQIF